MPELALDHHERDAFAGHLDRMRVPELVRGEPPAHPGVLSGASQLRADAGWRAWSTTRRAAQDAEQRSDRQRGAVSEPRSELLQAQRSMPTSRRLPPFP